MNCLRVLRASVFFACAFAVLTMFSVLQSIQFLPYDKQRYLLAKMNIVRKGDEPPKPPPWKIPKLFEYANPVRYAGPGHLISNLTFSPGLGNLMFQYASLVGIAKQFNRTLLLNADTLLRRAFRIKSAELVNPELGNVFIRSWTRHKVTNCCMVVSNVSNWLTNSNDNQVILGYFQSFKYFQKHEDEIRREFSFLPEIRRMAESHFSKALKASKLINPITVGIHVRHGSDLTLNLRNAMHGHISAHISYYRRAMEHFRSKYQHVLFIVVSDDPYHARKWVATAGDSALVVSGYREVDMCVLAMCQHTIISTGSFGWWSAWLAGGDVVYFKDWPRPNSKMDSMTKKADYFPQAWIGM